MQLLFFRHKEQTTTPVVGVRHMAGAALGGQPDCVRLATDGSLTREAPPGIIVAEHKQAVAVATSVV